MSGGRGGWRRSTGHPLSNRGLFQPEERYILLKMAKLRRNFRLSQHPGNPNVRKQEQACVCTHGHTRLVLPASSEIPGSGDAKYQKQSKYLKWESCSKRRKDGAVL